MIQEAFHSEALDLAPFGRMLGRKDGGIHRFFDAQKVEGKGAIWKSWELPMYRFTKDAVEAPLKSHIHLLYFLGRDVGLLSQLQDASDKSQICMKPIFDSKLLHH